MIFYSSFTVIYAEDLTTAEFLRRGVNEAEAMVDIIKVQADKPLIAELDKRFPKLFVDND